MDRSSASTGWPALAERATEMSPEARRALDRARKVLQPYFPGETMRLYVPQKDAIARAELRRRIERALRRGERPREIAAREKVSERYVRQLRGRFKAAAPLPP
jgi:hypothetical protein